MLLLHVKSFLLNNRLELLVNVHTGFLIVWSMIFSCVNVNFSASLFQNSCKVKQEKAGDDYTTEGVSACLGCSVKGYDYE